MSESLMCCCCGTKTIHRSSCALRKVEGFRVGAEFANRKEMVDYCLINGIMTHLFNKKQYQHKSNPKKFNADF